jgi:hypothetical protein
MATAQHFTLPLDLDALLIPWINANAKREDWGNAREMRTLLEKAREAQALRIVNIPTANLQELETDDLTRAMAER